MQSIRSASWRSSSRPARLLHRPDPGDRHAGDQAPRRGGGVRRARGNIERVAARLPLPGRHGRRRALRRWRRPRPECHADDRPHAGLFDRFDRLLAYVTLPGRRDMGRRQLVGGWAEVYVFDKPFRPVRNYRRAEKAAERSNRGVWMACGGVFHTPRSRDAPRARCSAGWGHEAAATRAP
jgi:hypothetical protein